MFRTLNDEIACPNCTNNGAIRFNFKVIVDPPVEPTLESVATSKYKLNMRNIQTDQINCMREGLPLVQCLNCARLISLTPFALVQE